MASQFRRMFTLLECIVVIAVTAILFALVLPGISRQGDSSRKMICSTRIRDIGLCEMEYEQTYKRLSSYNMTWGDDGQGRWGGFIALLPYLQKSDLYTAFQEGSAGDSGNKYVCWGPYGSLASPALSKKLVASTDSPRYVWSREYQPNRTQITAFRCPNNPGKIQPKSLWNSARTNYAFCLGDGQIGINGADPIESQTHSAFQRNHNYSMKGLTDGASNTIMFGEIATPETSSFAAHRVGAFERDAHVQGRAIYELAHQSDMKGIAVQLCRQLTAGGRYPGNKRNWGNIGVRNYDALANYTGFNTINAPNSGSCTPIDNAWGEGEGIYTVTSYHFGGAHVVTFDGSVKFINNSISTLDMRTDMTAADYYAPGRQFKDGQWRQTSNWTSESPFGVWGALGTISSGDDADLERPRVDD